MKSKLAAAAAVGLIGAALIQAPAQASWSELSAGRVGFWNYSYGDPYDSGRFGAYRTPDENGAWGQVLPSWLDYPRSMWNRDDYYTMYVYENPTCNSSGGRWVGTVRPGSRVNSTAGIAHWNSIQAFSFLAPTPNRRSCT